MRTLFSVAVLVMLALAGMAQQAPPAAPAPAGTRLDWLHWADVRTAPYMFGIPTLADGNPSTGTGFLNGPEVGGTIEFNFPAAVQVTALRVIQNGLLASTFELRADTAGKRTFDTVITTRKDAKAIGGQWITFPINRAVTGLRLAAISGAPGYREPYPNYREIEIYTQAPIAVQPPAAEQAGSALTAGAAQPMPIMLKRNIKFTPCIDIWNLGLNNDGSNMPDNIETYPPFTELINQLRDIDADGVRFFFESAAWAGKPWVTNYPPGAKKEVLKPVIDALHKRGYTTTMFLHAWMPPIQQEGKQAPDSFKRWDYPYEQSDLVLSKNLRDDKGNPIYTQRYPCIISDDDFKNKWTGILKETVDRGIDDVFVMPDEYYFKGHNLFTVNCPSCQKAFKAEFGYDNLPKPNAGVNPVSTTDFAPDPRTPIDTEQYRKWKLFEYEGIARLFDSVAAELKKSNPNLITTCSANPASPFFTNLTLEMGIAFDVIGRGKNINAVQLYGSVPMDVGRDTALARRMRGAFPNAILDSSIQALAFDNDIFNFPIEFYGYLLPHIMNGATRVHAYRLNYLQDNGAWPRVRKGIEMMRLLEQWNIADSATPADTCLLMSRASEDWWQVKAHSLLGNTPGDSKRNFLLYSDEHDAGATTTADATERALNYERIRGQSANKCMESLLIENGIQYDLHYTEREETLGDLAMYKVLILPFSYSMSQAAFESIRKAVDAGSILVIYDQLAPTNEYGTAYPQPLLQSLLDRKNVVYVKNNLAAEGMSLPFRQENRKLLYTLLNDGYYFNANNAKVEYLIRKLKDGSLILYLANWEREQTATPVVGVPLPAGQYVTTICSSKQEDLNTGLLGGQPAASEQTLAKFSVPLAPGEVQLIRIQPAPKK